MYTYLRVARGIPEFCSGPEVIKYSMLNSAEHEILNAHNNIKKFSFFSASHKPRMLFFLLIKNQMQTIVDILTFMTRKNFMLSMNFFYNLGAWFGVWIRLRIQY